MKIDLQKDNKFYTITFDEYGELDTVENNGKFLVSTNRVVKNIIANSESIRCGQIPKGFTKVRK